MSNIPRIILQSIFPDKEESFYEEIEMKLGSSFDRGRNFIITDNKIKLLKKRLKELPKNELVVESSVKTITELIKHIF